MKPYKILRPKESIWSKLTLEVFVTQKKSIKLPLKLFTRCHPLPRRITNVVKVIEV